MESTTYGEHVEVRWLDDMKACCQLQRHAQSNVEIIVFPILFLFENWQYPIQFYTKWTNISPKIAI